MKDLRDLMPPEMRHPISLSLLQQTLTLACQQSQVRNEHDLSPIEVEHVMRQFGAYVVDLQRTARKTSDVLPQPVRRLR